MSAVPALGARAPFPGGRLAFAAATVLLVAAHLGALSLQAIDAFRPNVALMLAMGPPYALACWLVVAGRARPPLAAILLVGLALRLVVLPFPPYHSTDVYRYVWDGRVQAAGHSPYAYVPADPALAPLRDATVFPRINRADYAPTIYPPLAQAFFLLVAVLGDALGDVLGNVLGDAVLLMKAALVACEGATLWAILRLLDREGLPRARAILYAWNPLAIWEFAGAGHLDALMIALAMLALVAARAARPGLAGALLGLGILVKFLPAILVPAVWRRLDPRLPLALAATVLAGYGVYALGAGRRVLGFLPGYAGEEGIRDGSGFWLARLAGEASGRAVPAAPYLACTALALAGLALAAWWGAPDRPRPRLGHALALTGAATLALSPQYPWYFAWLVPLACLVPSPGLVWLTASGFLMYWDYPRAVPWIGNVVYGGAVALLVAEAALRLGAPAHRRRPA